MADQITGKDLVAFARSAEAYDLLAAQMEAIKAGALRDLNRELFSGVVAKPYTPLTRRQRLAIKWARVRRYGSTLWSALRGRDYYDYDDY